jgi:deoxyribodipyrimidine photo-lyase
MVLVYIRDLEDKSACPMGKAQAWWLHHSLAKLSRAIEAKGSKLVLRSGKTLEVMADIIATTGASQVLWNRRYDPAGIAFDTALKSWLGTQGVAGRSFAGQLLHDPSRVLTGAGTPYKVYTPFWRALEASGEPPAPVLAPASITPLDVALAGDVLDDWKLLPTAPDWASRFGEVWQPGEDAAQEKLQGFVGGIIDQYKVRRDFPADRTTSLLSPHLAMGEISPCQVWAATQGLTERFAVEDVIHFRKELVWREFSWHLLFHFPDLPQTSLNHRFEAFPWRNDADLFEKWTKGKTGYPIVDAGMRQLWVHGWMHNRVRMVVASFLIKHLGMDWRLGQSWFEDTLVDADPASNAASWQWVAGCGADAAPFYRIFNPLLQGQKFDADGHYIRAFVPELKALAGVSLQAPAYASPLELHAAGIELGTTYPKPIVDHALARDRAMAAYNTLKDAA